MEYILTTIIIVLKSTSVCMNVMNGIQEYHLYTIHE